MITVSIRTIVAGDALAWLIERGDYQCFASAKRAATAIAYWKEIAKTDAGRDRINFKFIEEQRDLAMIFKLTWSK